MLILQTSVVPRRFSPFRTTKVDTSLEGFSRLGFLPYSPVSNHHTLRSISCSVSTKSPSKPEPEPEPKSSSKLRAGSKGKTRQRKDAVSSNDDENSADVFPTTIPRKPRRGRKSEAMKVEDFVRDKLERTFTAIRQQNADALENHENIMKDSVRDDLKSKSSDDDEEEEEKEDGGEDSGKEMVIEEESRNWPLDADVGWGIRASEYFEKHPIKNVVGEDGVEIDWEGEIDDNWVQEINCLEWESFAFHPSPLIVLVFERYNRATDNWKILKELEKAVKVYWSAKDRLPPRAIKIDINIERDLAYALKVRECPQILFLRGNRVVYREKELRTADELVQMIAFFYYSAKKPAWIDDKALYLRY